MNHDQLPPELAEWIELVERTREEALADLVPSTDPAPALAALERARTAWARVHDQLSLDLSLGS